MTATLFDVLQSEFCPPLDSSLLAALLAEIESDNDGNPLSPSTPQVEGLRKTLQELAAHADEAQLSEFSDLQLACATEDTISSQDLGLSVNTGDTSFTSASSSASSVHSFSSPLGFLQAAFPDVLIGTLKKVLDEAERDGRPVDMWGIVANVLTAESIRELEERGLDALDEEDGAFREEEIEWEIVSPRSRRKGPSEYTRKRKKGRTTKITLVDVRQQNHVKHQPKGSISQRKMPLHDPWTQASSIATHIAAYLSPHPPSLFLSYLHRPEYETPYKALCAALESVCKTDTTSDPDECSAVLFNLLDILFAEYEPLNSEERSDLVYETELCIRATGGHGDDAIDMVKLLRELNSDAASGQWEMGIYHLPLQTQKSPPPSPISPSTAVQRNSLPTSSNADLRVPLRPPPHTVSTARVDPYQWQTVPVRKAADKGPHPLAESTPAYARTAAGNLKVKGSGNGYGKGEKGDVGELSDIQGRIGEHRRKQEEFLRQAAKMWQRGSKKSLGGGIAQYYAEKVSPQWEPTAAEINRTWEAREFQDLAKQEALENARLMVQSKRTSTGNYDTIDLHGTTVYEALIIVHEILEESQCSPSQPLKIITGRGSHSVNKVAVLKPAIKNALVADGWTVGTWDAGLVVRGRNH